MGPNNSFRAQIPAFWAYVKIIGQAAGYTVRGRSEVSVPTLAMIKTALAKYKLDSTEIFSRDGKPTKFGTDILRYFECRAQMLNEFVEPRLMTAARAKKEFTQLKAKLKPKRPIPLNKQAGEKKQPAFLTGIVNMIVEANSGGVSCNYDPRELTRFHSKERLVYALSRRVDGSFPEGSNPVAIWEIKEYYYTTTFGSRVAGGVFESILDGFELAALKESYGIHCEHYLIVDAHYTWWECGKSYLCRLIDMLHMGYCDEILFGYEVIEQLPEIVGGWVKKVKNGHKR